MNDAGYYRDKIIDIVKEIKNPVILKLIYGFARSGYMEETAGTERTCRPV